MKAIKDTGNNLIAALDKSDSVGILDSYFPDADFFTEYERFDRHLEKQKRLGNKIDFVSVCSPNYLHDAHIRFGLRIGADVICEKPIVLNPWNIDALAEIEKEHTILEPSAGQGAIIEAIRKVSEKVIGYYELMKQNKDILESKELNTLYLGDDFIENKVLVISAVF